MGILMLLFSLVLCVFHYSTLCVCVCVRVCVTGKQGLKYGTVALTVLPRNGNSENSVFRADAPTF